MHARGCDIRAPYLDLEQGLRGAITLLLHLTCQLGKGHFQRKRLAIGTVVQLHTSVWSSHHITSHHITSHHITSHHITLHHITSHHITRTHHITSHVRITRTHHSCSRRQVHTRHYICHHIDTWHWRHSKRCDWRPCTPTDHGRSGPHHPHVLHYHITSHHITSHHITSQYTPRRMRMCGHAISLRDTGSCTSHTPPIRCGLLAWVM